VVATFTPAHRGGSGPPLLLLHGFTDTWRTWELVLPALERHHEVLAPTLPGHAGGPPLRSVREGALADAVEAALDGAGLGEVAVAGNSLGGYVALQLAARGRASSVVALAPAGGWALEDPSAEDTLAAMETMQRATRAMLPRLDALLASPAGRRRATRAVAEHADHLPPELVEHLVAGAALCDAFEPLTARARSHGWPLDSAAIACPVRIVWGAADVLLPWPRAATRWQAELPHAEWIVLDDVGHAPQLDVPLETAQLIRGFAR
jgi:pimeloyl-ACP methyl ester carboxylesterase